MDTTTAASVGATLLDFRCHSTTAQLRNATPRNAAQHHKDTQRAESGSRSLPITSHSHRAVCTNEADKRMNEADERTNERTFGERTERTKSALPAVYQQSAGRDEAL